MLPGPGNMLPVIGNIWGFWQKPGENGPKKTNGGKMNTKRAEGEPKRTDHPDLWLRLAAFGEVKVRQGASERVVTWCDYYQRYLDGGRSKQ